MELSYAELFAGAGGLSMGLEAAGFCPVAHAEIEPHARAVLRKHWPDCRLDGDVTQLNGADYRGITLLSGGSPCQDLSVAGKRKGLAGARSGLFYEQCRIWEESGAPYLLWENVLGALSSNAGKDFAAVLSALVGAAIHVPSDGWATGGVAAGRTAVAAWRVSDLQHFGPPPTAGARRCPRCSSRRRRSRRSIGSPRRRVRASCAAPASAGKSCQRRCGWRWKRRRSSCFRRPWP